MHIKSGVNSFLPAFVILAREDLDPGDVWNGLRVGRENRNWWCSSNGWDCYRWRESCNRQSYCSFDRSRGKGYSIRFHEQIIGGTNS